MNWKTAIQEAFVSRADGPSLDNASGHLLMTAGEIQLALEAETQETAGA